MPCHMLDSALTLGSSEGGHKHTCLRERALPCHPFSACRCLSSCLPACLLTASPSPSSCCGLGSACLFLPLVHGTHLFVLTLVTSHPTTYHFTASLTLLRRGTQLSEHEQLDPNIISHFFFFFFFFKHGWRADALAGGAGPLPYFSPVQRGHYTTFCISVLHSSKRLRAANKRVASMAWAF